MRKLYYYIVSASIFILSLNSMFAQEKDNPENSLETVSNQQKQEKNLLDGVIFESGSNILDPQSERVLLKALSKMLDNPSMRVEIRGYTDNLGTSESNLILSRQRAEAVKTWLVSHGINESRIKAIGFGSKNPVATNETSEGRRKNRRIEFVELTE